MALFLASCAESSSDDLAERQSAVRPDGAGDAARDLASTLDYFELRRVPAGGLVAEPPGGECPGEPVTGPSALKSGPPPAKWQRAAYANDRAMAAVESKMAAMDLSEPLSPSDADALRDKWRPRSPQQEKRAEGTTQTVSASSARLVQQQYLDWLRANPHATSRERAEKKNEIYTAGGLR